ncbi:unnamed protein product [Allacma fusca]|uniref:Transmembrane protein 170A n=1 Tax=Allacma fusca TaxID=39272 RepID=A0A8J2K7G0_9HEXA|nr:unnamed protein product [Allacma fusca]
MVKEEATMSAMSESLDSIANVLWLSPSKPLHTFVEMWYHIFLWAFFSSIFIHTIAALIAFATLRKHRIGRFFPILVFLMGIITPGTSGMVTSATIAFVYRASTLTLFPFYAFLYGTGQTLLFILFSFTRILATL